MKMTRGRCCEVYKPSGSKTMSYYLLKVTKRQFTAM